MSREPVESRPCIPETLGDMEVNRPPAEETDGWFRDTQNVP
jgi:hypothetical protein